MRQAAEAWVGTSAADLKARFEHKSAALLEKPPLAASVGRARVDIAYGLACEVDLEERCLRVDLPRSEGGTGSGPHPGQLMRASLGACLVMGYRLWAARLDVELADVHLELRCEYDERGQLGVAADVAIGWRCIHWVVTLVSDAADAELLRVVDTAHRYSPMLANLAREITRTFELRIERPKLIGSV
jgi:uncharacterized OsmC-like protein